MIHGLILVWRNLEDDGKGSGIAFPREGAAGWQRGGNHKGAGNSFEPIEAAVHVDNVRLKNGVGNPKTVSDSQKLTQHRLLAGSWFFDNAG
ncbi:MAG: hypothetical protein ABSE90_10365 [Verrucomicrobiota bacterium]|jgi:hypothetical protein